MKRSTVILTILAGYLGIGTGYALWNFTSTQESLVVCGIVGGLRAFRGEKGVSPTLRFRSR